MHKHGIEVYFVGYFAGSLFLQYDKNNNIICNYLNFLNYKLCRGSSSVSFFVLFFTVVALLIKFHVLYFCQLKETLNLTF